ncbi:response regulator [bacterium]|nr:response regulator [bacterium]
MKIRLLLADDHEVVRKGFRSLLEKQTAFIIVGEATNGQEVVRMAQELNPDIVVMDISMPKLSGIDATRQIKKFNPSIKILALSVHSRGSLIGQIIRAGASGYLPKSSSVTELLKAIHTIMKNHTYICPKIMDTMVEYFQDESDRKRVTSDILTIREREIVKLIADGKTTKEIGAILCISEKTVESHRYQLMNKLGIHNMAELIKFAIQQGITSFETDEEYA